DRVYCEGMRDTDLFQLALGLQSPWTVTRSEFAVEDGRLDLYVDFPRGSRFACAECGREGCAVHDTKDETWRHLDFFQHRTLLHARVPRGAGQGDADRQCGQAAGRARHAAVADCRATCGARWRRWICLTCSVEKSPSISIRVAVS